MSENVQARIDIEVRGGESAERATTSLRDLAAWQSKAVASSDQLTVASDKLNKVRERSETMIDRLAKKYDRDYKVEQQRIRDVASLNRAYESGLGGTEAYSRALAGIESHYSGLGRGLNDNNKLLGTHADHVGFAQHQWLNLNRQLQDAGTMLASGSSMTQVFSTQAAQIYDVFASSKGGAAAGLREFGSAVAGAITPTRVLGAAVVAAAGVSIVSIARWKSETDELAASLDGLGRFSGVSLGGAQGLADRAAAQSGMSTRSAAHIVSSGLGAGLDAVSAGGVATIAKEFSTKLGLELEDAAKELTGALVDPAKGADDLARKYGLVTLAQAHHIDELTKVGDRSGAAAELLRDLHAALDTIADRRSPISRMIDRIETSVSNTVTNYGRNLANSTNPIDRKFNEFFGIKPDQPIAAEQISRDEAQRRLVQHRADIAGQDILGLARETAPDLFARHDLEQQVEKLQRAFGRDGVGKVLDDLGVTGDMTRQTLDRLRVGLDLLQTPMQRVAEANALSLRSAEAETTGQRAQIAAEQAYKSELQSSRDKIAAATAAEGARNVAIAESTRAMRDQAKEAEKRADLAGLGPYERAIREAQITLREDLRKANLSPGDGARMDIYTRPTIDGFSQVGSAATRLADVLTGAADRIGRIITIPEQKAATSNTTPMFARAGGDFYSSIMRAEGTTKFGDPYNTSLGYRASPKPLVEMSMRESLAWGEEIARQEMIRTRKPREDVSSAKGAYQIVNSTQRDAMRALGLGQKDMFSADNQNRMADWIFRKQGLGAWEGFKTHPNDKAVALSSSSSIGDETKKLTEAGEARRKYNATIRAIDTEQIDAWMKDENRTLDEQRRALDLAAGSWSLNASAIAAAEEKQHLLNEAQRRTIPVTQELAHRLDELSLKAAENARRDEENARAKARYIAELDIGRSAINEGFTGPLKALSRGEDPGRAALSALQATNDRFIDLVGGQFTEALLGKVGSTNTGAIGSLFGIGGDKTAAQMNVNAGVVNVNGGVGGAVGAAGGGSGGGGLFGWLGNAVGSLFGGGSIPTMAQGGYGPDMPVGFADGGVMTSAGALQMQRSSSGGIANRPQLALFGEGRHPEAYIPMPDGRSISVAVDDMGRAHAELPGGRGVPVTLRGAGAGELGSSRSRLSAFADGGVMTAQGQAADRLYRSTDRLAPQTPAFDASRMMQPMHVAPNYAAAPAAAPAPVTVNVHNAPAGTQVKESTDAKGGRRIDVLIDERIAAALNSPSGRGTMSDTFGVRQKLRRI